MTRNGVEKLGDLIREAIATIPPPNGRKDLTKAIYRALTSNRRIRSALKAQFDGPIVSRYAGSPSVVRNGRTRKVLGYLWDFSFSRHAIPEAIKQHGRDLPSAGKKYEILLVIESELGTFDEICRDLLKLLDARAAIRCLIYKQPTPQHLAELHRRFIDVLHNHAHFNPRLERLLFMGISWGQGKLSCDGYVLAANRLRRLRSARAVQHRVQPTALVTSLAAPRPRGGRASRPHCVPRVRQTAVQHLEHRRATAACGLATATTAILPPRIAEFSMSSDAF